MSVTTPGVGLYRNHGFDLLSRAVSNFPRVGALVYPVRPKPNRMNMKYCCRFNCDLDRVNLLVHVMVSFSEFDVLKANTKTTLPYSSVYKAQLLYQDLRVFELKKSMPFRSVGRWPFIEGPNFKFS